MARIDLPDGAGPEVVRALQLAPHFGPVVASYEQAVAATGLDPRLHELVRYRVAVANQCTICLAYRLPGADVDDTLLAQVTSWQHAPGFTPTERAALEFTERFCADSTSISDDLLARLETLLSPAGLVDLTLVVGKYLAMGRFMQVLGLDQACSVSEVRAGAAAQ